MNGTYRVTYAGSVDDYIATDVEDALTEYNEQHDVSAEDELSAVLVFNNVIEAVPVPGERYFVTEVVAYPTKTVDVGPNEELVLA